MKRHIKISRQTIILSLAVIYYLSYFIFGIFGEKYLHADGSYTFYNLLGCKDFTVYPLGRAHYDYMFELPIVIGLKLGIQHLPTLGLLLGIGESMWVPIFFTSAILIYLYHKNYLFAELTFILSFFSLTFVGFSQTIESPAALGCFALALALSFSHTSKSPKWETGLMILLIPLCYHMNEMFMFWGVVAAFVILFRVFFAKGDRKLSKIWCIYAISWLIIAFLSGGSVSARSGGGMPSVAGLLREMLACDPKVAIGNLVIIMILIILSESSLKNRLTTITKISLTTILLVIDLFYIFTRSGRLAGSCFNLRFCNLAAGVVFGIVLLVLHGLNEKLHFTEFSALLCSLCIIGCSYNIVSAVEFRHLNDDLCAYAQSHTGYIDENDTPIFEENHWGYYWGWSLAHQSAAAQILRGYNDLHCVIIGEQVVYDPYDKNSYQVYSEYGVTLSLP